MDYHYLGNTGLRVSELCLGTMTFGNQEGWGEEIGSLNQTEADAFVAKALDAGVNFFDTADIYSKGASEKVLGKALGQKRTDVVLATKVGFAMGDGPNADGLTRKRIVEGCEASLRRLGTDYIDLYQVHCFDPATPLEETVRALDDLVRDGKVCYVGCSNFAGWQLMKALAIADHAGLERFASLQVCYNLVQRGIEYELAPLCKEQGIGIMPWSPLAGGFLTGKYRSDQERPSGSRLSDPYHQAPFDEEQGYEVVEELDRIAVRHDATVPQAALNYLLRKKHVTSVIVGARKMEQLEDNLAATTWTMKEEEVTRLDELSKPRKVYPYWFIEQSRENRQRLHR